VVRRLSAFNTQERPEFTPQNIANTAYAYAKADHAAPALFNAISAKGPRSVHRFNPTGYLQHGVGIRSGQPLN